jgi:hypothetical protein
MQKKDYDDMECNLLIFFVLNRQSFQFVKGRVNKRICNHSFCLYHLKIC